MTTPPDTPKPPADDVFALHCAHGKPVYGRCLDCEKILAPSPQESHKLAEELEHDAKYWRGHGLVGVAGLMERAAAALRSSPSEQRDAKRTRECSCVSTCYKAAGERLGDNWHCRVELPIIGLFAGSRVDEVIDAFLAEAAIAASGGAQGDGNG